MAVVEGVEGHVGGGEVPGEKEWKTFGEEVGSYPCFVAEVIARK